MERGAGEAGHGLRPIVSVCIRLQIMALPEPQIWWSA